HDALPRVQLDLDELQIVTVDLEVDFMRSPPGDVGDDDGSAGLFSKNRRKDRDVFYRRPVSHAGSVNEGVGLNAAVLDVGNDFLCADRSYLVAANRHVPLVRISHTLSPSRAPVGIS